MVSRYSQSYEGRASISGLLIFRWRPRDSTYAFEGYANAAMDPHRLAGRWERGLVFEGSAFGMPTRESWRARGTDTLVNAMEFMQDGSWIKTSEAVLVRRK
jgi:hypothetical protein